MSRDKSDLADELLRRWCIFLRECTTSIFDLRNFCGPKIDFEAKKFVCAFNILGFQNSADLHFKIMKLIDGDVFHFYIISRLIILYVRLLWIDLIKIAL